MQYFSWHDYLVVFSSIAAIAGLALAITGKSEDPLTATDRTLFLMIFTYWLVYCVATISQKLIHLEWEWEWMLFSIRLTGLIAYLLTFTCIVSLPLHRYAVHRQTE
jgi:Fe2+ transport system protein B